MRKVEKYFLELKICIKYLIIKLLLIIWLLNILYNNIDIDINDYINYIIINENGEIKPWVIKMIIIILILLFPLWLLSDYAQGFDKITEIIIKYLEEK